VGAVGLLAAFALRLRGAQVYGLDIVDEDTPRPQILKEIGGHYVDGRKIETVDLDKEIGHMDFIFEAAGFAELQIELIDALATNGIYVSTGIPGGERPIKIDGAALMRQLVLKNQVVLGSVNASPEHFKLAVEDLNGIMKQWPDQILRMITGKVPFSNFEAALKASPDEIKVVVEWE
jgi:glucose 1-dehydrogenase